MVRSLTVFSILALLLFQGNLKGQPQETAPGTYILFLKDKKHSSFNLENPSAFISQRAIERRSRQGIKIDSTDLPVSTFYTDSLKKFGIQIHNVSKWFNSVTFKTDNPDLLGSLDFVKKIERTTPLKLNMYEESSLYDINSYDSTFYGLAYKQIHIHNGDFLHQSGLRGEKMLIAVIDAGFSNYQNVTGFQQIRSEGRIKGIRDFVKHDGDVNLDNAHGMHVFSIIGTELENSFVGTAPKADFLLLRSEDATPDIYGLQSEYLVEEDNWIAAAEYADSLGTDVINTSLGYSIFNFPEQNHSYEDMNGENTRVSKAAGMASKKGMIVVVSAGNEGDSPWTYISAPADAKNILAVGAINNKLTRAGFSSIGPTSDNRVKPDVMAVGWGTYFQSTTNNIIAGSGTSFAAPVITGLTACLWQGSPDKTNVEIMEAIRKSSHKFENPDNLYGYGIPDFKKAMMMLNPVVGNKNGMTVYPNPFTTRLTLIHQALSSNSLKLEIFNTSGKKLYTRIISIEPNTTGEITIPDVTDIPRGMVIIRIIAGDKVLTSTAIKF